MDMQWWHWAVLGLVLGLLELATPGGFFILFFGIGALLVSVLSLLGIAGPLWVQWVTFGALSVITLFFFRDPLLRRMRASERNTPIDQLTSDIAVAKEDIAPRRHRPRRAARIGLERAEHRRRRPASRPALRRPEGGRPDAPHDGGRRLSERPAHRDRHRPALRGGRPRRRRPPLRHDRHQPPQQGVCSVNGPLIFAIAVVVVLPDRGRQDRDRRAAAERLRRRAPRPLQQHAPRRLPHPRARSSTSSATGIR